MDYPENTDLSPDLTLERLGSIHLQRKRRNEVATDLKPALAKIQLPSDQDATGRELGDDEMLQLWPRRSRAARSPAPRGSSSNGWKSDFAAYMGVDARLRLLARHGGAAHGDRRDRSRAGRRDRHHRDHRHGRPDADPLPVGDPRVRRRRPAHLQRHRRHDRSGAQPADQGDHGHAPVRQSVPHGRDHGAGPRSRHPGDRGLRPGVRRRDRRPQGRRVGRHRLLQPAAGQAHHHRRRRPRRVRQRRPRPPHVPVHQQGLGLRRQERRTTTSSPSTTG